VGEDKTAVHNVAGRTIADETDGVYEADMDADMNSVPMFLSYLARRLASLFP
jgi:hypothetical protein